MGLNGDHKIDLREKDLQALKRTLSRFDFVAETRIFGSRATGHARRDSDIDLAIAAPTADERQWSDLVEAIEATPIIHAFDIVRLERAGNPRLLEKIAREGVVIHPTNPTTIARSGPDPR